MTKLLGPFVGALLVATMLVAPLARTADAATLDSAESSLLVAVNSFRAARGLSTLVASDTLTYAAKWMATDMAVNNYFSHTSLDGRSPTQRMADFGYPAFATWAGEDLAAGYATATEVLNGWIASPAHYAVLTNPNYRAIGIGRASFAGSTYGWYWAADFGGVIDAPTTAPRSDPGFHAAWAGQSPDPVLAPGQRTTVVVALKNTGYRGWYLGSPGQQATLATADPLDVARPDLAAGWIALNRITAPTTSWVGPGQVGWFQFQIQAPPTPGTYRLGVRGVVDGTTWLEDQGITFTLTVR